MADPTGAFDLAALSALAADAPAALPLPPVHLWNPPNCGDIDIRIARDGTWYHEGSPIGRAAMVRLFSTVLRKDPDGFHLVTPVEKLRIQVEDAPFLAVALDAVGGRLRFRTNVDDEVEADAEHPIIVERDAGGGPAPYVRVRDALLARLTRPVFYQLVELARPREGGGDGELGVWSRGCWFPIGAVEAA